MKFTEDKLELAFIESLGSEAFKFTSGAEVRDVNENLVTKPKGNYNSGSSKKDTKIVCPYPTYYAARKLYKNIKLHQRPEGCGKGGTYFGATGSGKSYTMLFLTRLMMKSTSFSSPTIVFYHRPDRFE